MAEGPDPADYVREPDTSVNNPVGDMVHHTASETEPDEPLRWEEVGWPEWIEPDPDLPPPKVTTRSYEQMIQRQPYPDPLERYPGP